MTTQSRKTCLLHSSTFNHRIRRKNGADVRAFAKEKQKSEGVEAGGCVYQKTRYLTDILSFHIHIRPIKYSHFTGEEIGSESSLEIT